MHKRHLFLIIFTLLWSTAMAQDNQTKVFPYSYETETLDNGLKVILIPMSSKGLVSYYSVVRTGSRDEWEPGHSGFAHFFEHMMFRGTKTYPGPVYDRLITGMGADANAYTTDDYTCYHLSIASEDLEKVMELESDRFQNLFYEEREFQTESGAVYGEYRKGRTNPWSVLEEKLQETAFDVHTYKHTTMGFEADIKAMPTMYEYSRNFFSRYYRPENVVLLITGDIDPAATFELVRKYYGAWQKGYKTPSISPEPEQKAGRNAEVSYPGKTLPILSVAWKGERFDARNKRMVASVMLGELAFGENSELYKRLVLQEQKVQFVAAEFGNNRDPFLWTVYTMVKKEADIDGVNSEILTTAEKYTKHLVGNNTLADLKQRLRYEFLMNLDTPEKVAGGLARYIAITGGIDVIEDLYATFDSITPEDIRDAAAACFVPAHRTIVTLRGSK
jgi:zinc protease